MLKINPEVLNALKENKPVVALESTIISHGMPYPKNVETALMVEKVIRDHGAIPATIGVINGDAIVGMTPEEIEQFGKRKGILKVSRRDLPVVYAKKLWAATTVAATMIIAHEAGIKLFVTGGIGGVHRGAQETMDISADLQELAHTPVAVVGAGCKSILDIGLTLEYLETMGVPVLGYKTEDFPAFYCRKSGFGVDYKLEDANEAARILKTKWDLGLEGGFLIGNPIPEEYALDYDEMEKVIQTALDMAKKDGIRGKATTPYLLAHIKDLTKGVAFASNVQLALNNARVASQISVELSKLK